MMGHSKKKFVLGTLMGAILGCTLVLFIWQMVFRENQRSEISVTNEGSSNALPDMQFSYDIDSWRTLLQITEKSLTLSDYANFLEKKSTADLTRLAIQSLELEQDKEIHLFQDLVISKLALKSPQTTLDLIWKFPWSRHQKLINTFVLTLSTVDLEQSLALAKNLPNYYLDDALRTTLASRPDYTQRDWMTLTMDATVSKRIVRLLRETEVIAHLDQPSVAWDQLLEDKVKNDEQRELLVLIANARVETEGFEVLSQLYESMYSNNQFLLESVMREILNDEPSMAFQSVKHMPYESRNFVLPILIETWAIQNPREAYFALTEISEYHQLWGDLSTLRAWSKLDSLDVLDSLSDIKRSDRNSAISAAFSELAKSNPDKIIQRLEGLKEIPGVSADDLEWKLVSNWSEYDPLKAINWIEENTVTGTRIQSRMLKRALLRLVHIDGAKAWEIALRQPRDSYFVEDGEIGSLFSAYVEEGYLNRALELLEDLPAAAVYRGFSAVGRGLVEADRWSDALELIDSLESDNRESYVRSLASTAANRNVKILIDRLKEMPNNEIRNFMADELVRQHEWRGDVLTEQQLEVVQSLLPMEEQNSDLNDS